jgi:hypothetical protein
VTKLLEDFIESGAEPFPDNIYGPGYRCSVDLIDGTHMPCVMIRRRHFVVELARRRLAEESTGARHHDVLESFVTGGNRVAAYNIRRVTPSRFAIPLAVLNQVHGETLMSWTGFVLEMNDGKPFAFANRFLNAFFDLPEGYGFNDVRSVTNHSYIDESGQVCAIHDDTSKWRDSFFRCVVFREKPYFDCFI